MESSLGNRLFTLRAAAPIVQESLPMESCTLGAEETMEDWDMVRIAIYVDKCMEVTAKQTCKQSWVISCMKMT